MRKVAPAAEAARALLEEEEEEDEGEDMVGFGLECPYEGSEREREEVMLMITEMTLDRILYPGL
jgi:hypothetical protein